MEIDAIKALIDADQVVIACGGGGIPVMQQDHRLKGASAVIEKDLAAGKLAEAIDADELIILTSVEKVRINMNTPKESELGEISLADARQYMEEGHFGVYNMLPKFRASVEFIEKREGPQRAHHFLRQAQRRTEGKDRNDHPVGGYGKKENFVKGPGRAECAAGAFVNAFTGHVTLLKSVTSGMQFCKTNLTFNVKRTIL